MSGEFGYRVVNVNLDAVGLYIHPLLRTLPAPHNSLAQGKQEPGARIQNGTEGPELVGKDRLSELYSWEETFYLPG